MRWASDARIVTAPGALSLSYVVAQPFSSWHLADALTPYYAHTERRPTNGSFDQGSLKIDESTSLIGECAQRPLSANEQSIRDRRSYRWIDWSLKI